MNRILVPTGYMGSGSSAITDLVSEYRGYESNQDTFEYVFLHCPNGLFDLEDKLLVGNTALRSDEALHSFLQTMKQLYDKKYWWVGHVQERVSADFYDLCTQLVQNLTQYKPDFYWYAQENTNLRMTIQLIWRKVVKLLTCNRVVPKKPLLYPEIWLSYPTPEEFYTFAKEFLRQIWDRMGIQEHPLLLDQLLLPHNLHRVDRYFDDNLAVFVVDRDPRDVFIINKYVWASRNEVVPFPTDPEAFAQCYLRMRQSEHPCHSEKVHRIHFEDLVYHYEDSVARVEQILGLTSQDHLRPQSRFDPSKSIQNTQLFRVKPEYAQEVQPLEELLRDYLYPFPYERCPDITQSF